MIKRFKAWLHSIRLMSADPVISTITKASSTQEDAEERELIKRVHKAFDAQEQDMQIRAMKRHGPKCKGVTVCTKEDCFKWKPDKIVSKKYTVENSLVLKRRRSKNKELIKKIDDNN